jgi:hypothetical protein
MNMMDKLLICHLNFADGVVDMVTLNHSWTSSRADVLYVSLSVALFISFGGKALTFKPWVQGHNFLHLFGLKVINH